MVKYTIRWESDGRKVPILGRGKWVSISKALLIWWFPHFSMLWEIDWETHVFHILSSIPWDVNLMGKQQLYYGKNMSTNFPGSPHTMGFTGFSREPISQDFFIRWAFLSIPMQWEIDHKTHSFLIWWSIPQYGNLMKKVPILCMGTNFTGLAHSVGFVDFSNTMWNLMRKPMYFSCDED